MIETHQTRRAKVAIVGAGIAGLSCARTLIAAGNHVTIFDKARKPGGRCSTRRVDATAALSFDHGAQYFTVRDRGFAELVARGQTAGTIQAWKPRLWSIAANGHRTAPGAAVDDTLERLVGVPGMSALAKLLVAELGAVELHASTRITSVQREKFDWELGDEHGRRHTGFDRVVLNMPADQAAPLLAYHTPSLQARAQACRMEPCWTVMVEPKRPLTLEFDAAFVAGSPLAWIADNATKPGRPPHQAWVLQASGEWSEANLELDPASVIHELLASFSAVVGRTLEPAYVSAHCWRYAKPEPLPEPHLYSSLGIGACGDWCGGPRIEGAFVSGRSLGEAIIASQST